MVAGRRPQGIGTLTERPAGSGKWQWRLRLKNDPVTGKPRRLTRTIEAKSLSAAEAKARKLLAEMEKDPIGSAAPMSVVFREWMRYSEADKWSPHTIDWNQRAIDNVLNPAIGDIPVNRLTAWDLDNLYVKLLAKPLSPSTVRKYHAVVSAALGKAKKWGWIDDDPARRASPPKIPRRRLTVPTPDEIGQIISELEAINPVYGLAAYLAARTGLRRGEVCALRWSDWHDGVIEVSASLYRVKGETGIKSTKTDEERLVLVTSDLAFALERRRATSEQLAESFECAIAPEAFILSAWPDGSRPINPDSLTSAFSRTAKALGLGHVHFHSLRHFAATEMRAAGTSPQDAAKALGHADPTMTLNVYAHPTTDRLRAAFEAVSKALEPPAHD